MIGFTLLSCDSKLISKTDSAEYRSNQRVNMWLGRPPEKIGYHKNFQASKICCILRILEYPRIVTENNCGLSNLCLCMQLVNMGFYRSQILQVRWRNQRCRLPAPKVSFEIVITIKLTCRYEAHRDSDQVKRLIHMVIFHFANFN